MAAKGRMAPSENAGNADLVAAGFFGREKDPDLKANPWSVVGTNGSKIELLLFDDDEMKGLGAAQSLGRWILNL